ncbi:MAG: hypothetical protein F4137_04610 [Acidobacteria bacterium]|nr:hypothetical protein [Acidobacteriota bacterium]
MERRIPRRSFVIGLGTGAAAASLLLATRESALGPSPVPIRVSTPARSAGDACCSDYADYDGWLVTRDDKRRLAPDRVRYDDGWHAAERHGDATLRWTRGSATLTVVNPRTAATLHLDYNALAGVFGDVPQVVTLSAGDHVLSSFPAGAAGRRVLDIPLGTGVLGDRDRAVIRIDVDRTFVPANAIEGASDTRELGIQVYGVRIEAH